MSCSDIVDTISTPIRTVGELADRLPQGTVLLAVWAHPDDESYLAAGLMAEVARRGGRVVNVSATAGEHGTSDPRRWPPAELARLRRRELDAALRTIGAEPSIVLGHRDGFCDRVRTSAGAADIGAIIHLIRPDVVVEFGPDGVTGHPDHLALARWTELAVTDTSLPLLVTAAGCVWPETCVDRMHQARAFWPGHPRRDFDHDVWHVALDERLRDQKMAALGCHAHQVEPMRALLGSDEFRSLAAVEAYRPMNRAAARLMNAGNSRSAA
jgi:LmbE family N-acetylglucosaminyl deacetylase